MPARQPPSRYKVLQRLASGGMADVYLAVLRGAHGFEKQTIVKRMRPELEGHDEYRRMFIDEARLMASLSHSNVVSVMDFGDGDDGIFLALEYVDGTDLAVLEKRVGSLPPALALYIGCCVLEALSYVHGRRTKEGKPLHIVHRDVSPSNVFLGRNGDVKLGDFGVAKMALGSVHTLPGTIKGKIAYMSPEQAAAQEVDGRSDLFSLGIVLFEALTGRRPFTAQSDVSLLKMVTEDEAPDARVTAPSLSPSLAAFLRKALARERDARFQSAEEMKRALLACAQGPLLGPSDVARFVAANVRAADAAPVVDPFAAALGLDGGEEPSPGGSAITSTRRLNAEGKGPMAAAGAPRGRRGLLAAALALGAVAAGAAGYWALKPGPQVSLEEIPQAEVTGSNPSTPLDPAPPTAPVAVTIDAGPAVGEPKPLRVARAPKGKATIDVNSTPWAKVYLDGTFVGETAVTGLETTAGKHRLRLHNPTVNKTWERTIELSAGEHRVIPVDLESDGVAGKL